MEFNDFRRKKSNFACGAWLLSISHSTFQNSFNGNVCTLIKIENCIQNVLHEILQANGMCRHRASRTARSVVLQRAATRTSTWWCCCCWCVCVPCAFRIWFRQMVNFHYNITRTAVDVLFARALASVRVYVKCIHSAKCRAQKTICFESWGFSFAIF